MVAKGLRPKAYIRSQLGINRKFRPILFLNKPKTQGPKIRPEGVPFLRPFWGSPFPNLSRVTKVRGIWAILARKVPTPRGKGTTPERNPKNTRKGRKHRFLTGAFP